MSRRYANILTAIWRNDDFRALNGSAQRLFLLLCTQPDISAAGVLSLNIKRWSRCAKDTTPQTVVADIEELEAGRFIVADPDTEELLVRSFVRWDNGYGNPKRRPVIIRAAQEVESAIIRRSLAFEFKRLGLPVEGVDDSLSDSQPASAPLPTPPPPETEESLSQVNRLSDREAPSDGVVVTKGPYVSPQPSNHNPQTQPSADPAAPSAPAGKTKRGTRLPDDWKPNQALLEWAAGKSYDRLVDLDFQTEKFCNHFHAKTGKDATKLDWNKTWQNWVMEEVSRLQRRGGHLRPVPHVGKALAPTTGDLASSQSPADRGMAAALELAERFKDRSVS